MLEEMARRMLRVCKEKGWKTDWSARGCYLHLEVSELIEAIRGKGDTPAAAEAAQVLLVFLSLLEAYGVSIRDVLGAAGQELARLEMTVMREGGTLDPTGTPRSGSTARSHNTTGGPR